jgi:hypothetical protein
VKGGDRLKLFLIILVLLAVFVAGVLASPKLVATNLVQIDLRALSKGIDTGPIAIKHSLAYWLPFARPI